MQRVRLVFMHLFLLVGSLPPAAKTTSLLAAKNSVPPEASSSAQKNLKNNSNLVMSRKVRSLEFSPKEHDKNPNRMMRGKGRISADGEAMNTYSLSM